MLILVHIRHICSSCIQKVCPPTMGNDCQCTAMHCEDTDLSTTDGKTDESSETCLCNADPNDETKIIYKPYPKITRNKISTLISGYIRHIININNFSSDITNICVSFLHKKDYLFKILMIERNPVRTVSMIDTESHESITSYSQPLTGSADIAVTVYCNFAEYGRSLPNGIKSRLKSINSDEIYNIVVHIGFGDNRSDPVGPPSETDMTFHAEIIALTKCKVTDHFSLNLLTTFPEIFSIEWRIKPVYDGHNKIITFCNNNICTLNLNNMNFELKPIKTEIYRKYSSLCKLPASSRIMIIGGEMTDQNAAFVQKSETRNNGDCNLHHYSIKECEIYDYIEDKSISISNMNYPRKYAGCVYNKCYDQVIVAGGVLFQKSFAQPDHCNHTLEIYDMNKDKWRVLPQKLLYKCEMYEAFEYMSFQTNLWIDSFNPNIVYIFAGGIKDRTECEIQFVDTRENDKNVGYCYTVSPNVKLDGFCNIDSQVVLDDIYGSYMTHL